MKKCSNIDSEKYFSNICDKLEKSAKVECPKSEVDFSTLKILEYWVRILQQSPECINSEIAIRLMDEDHLRPFVTEIVAVFDAHFKAKRKSAKKSVQAMDDESDDNIEFPRILGRIEEYVKSVKKDPSVVNCFLKALSSVDAGDMPPEMYRDFQHVMGKHFTMFALDKLREGLGKKDAGLMRARKIKELYRLTDDEMELLLYLWLRESKDLELESGEINLRHVRRYRDTDSNGKCLLNMSRATGFSTERLSELFSNDSSLTRLGLLDDQLDLPREVSMCLSGYSDCSSMKAFGPAAPAVVSFLQLQGKNPDANMVLTLLKNHNRKQPLNILFYGVPGTGKTELAKALAAEMEVPLWEVKIDAEDDEIGGRRLDSRTNNLLQYRLRALTLADWHCEKNPGIILVDEADLVLNCCEKGALNSLFERLRTPVIWISNNMGLVEDSTRRRFDFSMAFKPLAKDERLSVLNSVLKTQNFENVLSDEEKLKLVVEYPAMAGGYTLAIQHTKFLLESGAAQPVDCYKNAARILKAHTNLLGINTGSLKDVESHAPNYSLEGLNIEGSTTEIIEVVKNYDAAWQCMVEDDVPNSLNILLYGPPGTGKTEFVRYIARTLGRNLIIKRASDLLGMYVGQTEAKIAAAFEEANRTKSILFFDEADSILSNRANAMQNHEVSKVNELLTQMENFKGIFVAATNFENHLDPASSRRFALKLGFDYLKPEGVGHIWNMFFPQVECPDSVKNLPMLTPGDFNAVNGRLRYFPASSKTPERIESELRKELRCKDPRAGRTMGF